MKKFSFNPFNGVFIDSAVNHAEAIYNHYGNVIGACKAFDSYIRGIIKDDVLYLRTFYPYDDIDNLLWDDIQKKSRLLLGDYQTQILKAIKRQYDFIPSRIVLNADNDLLRNELQTNFI